MRQEDRERLTRERYEDAMWMLSNGETMERAALRLGMKAEALRTLIKRQEERGQQGDPATSAGTGQA